MAKGKMPPPSVRAWTWFKTFTKLIDDPRFLLLSFEEQRHYMMIYNCKAQGVIDRYQSDPQQLLQMVAVKLRVAKNVLELAVMRMWEVGLLIQNTLQPADWDAEQTEPASPGAERVARHRAKKSKGTVAAAQPTALDWPTSIPASSAQAIKPVLLQLRHLERDGEPMAQLVLDEIVGFAKEHHINSYEKIAIFFSKQALDGGFHPEFGKPISAARRRRGEPLQPGNG